MQSFIIEAGRLVDEFCFALIDLSVVPVSAFSFQGVWLFTHATSRMSQGAISKDKPIKGPKSRLPCRLGVLRPKLPV
jgi:hypothetical protein